MKPRVPFPLIVVGAIVAVIVVAYLSGIDPAYQFAIDVVAVAVGGIVLAAENVRHRGSVAAIVSESPEMDFAMLMALATPNALGPNDLIRRRDDTARAPQQTGLVARRARENLAIVTANFR